jgi:hypothetical protein
MTEALVMSSIRWLGRGGPPRRVCIYTFWLCDDQLSTRLELNFCEVKQLYMFVPILTWPLVEVLTVWLHFQCHCITVSGEQQWRLFIQEFNRRNKNFGCTYFSFQVCVLFCYYYLMSNSGIDPPFAGLNLRLQLIFGKFWRTWTKPELNVQAPNMFMYVRLTVFPRFAAELDFSQH